MLFKIARIFCKFAFYEQIIYNYAVKICVTNILGNLGKNTQLSVYINEVVPSNGSNLQDEDGEYVDWIELYNDGEESVSLKGFGLSDQKSSPKLWEFPDVKIDSKSYLIVYRGSLYPVSG